MYSHDRKPKIDPTRVKAIFDKAAGMYLESHSTYTAGSALPASGGASEVVLPTGVARPAR